jgi:hypothetical protein
MHQALSSLFLADLDRVYVEDCSPALGDAESDLDELAGQFSDWRAAKRKQIRALLSSLPEDDPIRCPISLLGTLDFGRLETAHTRTLAWLLDPGREHGFGAHLLRSLLAHVRGGLVLRQASELG